MSVLQKAIRRGREDLALSAASSLLRDAPDKLWRRIGCIAHEDVGVASLEVVGLTTAALAGKQARAALGGEWAVASCVVAELTVDSQNAFGRCCARPGLPRPAERQQV
jgi:replication-associated recombination protein RarA